jgi:hypothetical protein
MDVIQSRPLLQQQQLKHSCILAPLDLTSQGMRCYCCCCRLTAAAAAGMCHADYCMVSSRMHMAGIYLLLHCRAPRCLLLLPLLLLCSVQQLLLPLLLLLLPLLLLLLPLLLLLLPLYLVQALPLRLPACASAAAARYMYNGLESFFYRVPDLGTDRPDEIRG